MYKVPGLPEMSCHQGDIGLALKDVLADLKDYDGTGQPIDKHAFINKCETYFRLIPDKDHDALICIIKSKFIGVALKILMKQFDQLRNWESIKDVMTGCLDLK